MEWLRLGLSSPSHILAYFSSPLGVPFGVKMPLAWLGVLDIESDLLRVNAGEASEGLVAEVFDCLAKEDAVGDSYVARVWRLRIGFSLGLGAACFSLTGRGETKVWEEVVAAWGGFGSEG